MQKSFKTCKALTELIVISITNITFKGEDGEDQNHWMSFLIVIQHVVLPKKSDAVWSKLLSLGNS